MTESNLNWYIKKFLQRNNLRFEKYVSSVYSKSGTSDFVINLPNQKVIYLEIKGFENKNYSLSLLQKIFLLQNSKNAICWYINSPETLENFEDYIVNQRYLEQNYEKEM